MFIHLGELSHRADGTLEASTGDKPVITTATVRSHGPALSALGRLPLTDSLDIELRLGDYFGRTILTHGFEFDSKYQATTLSANASSLLAGVGAAYTFAGHWSVRLDYLRINRAGQDNTVGKYSANLATIGARFTF
jgi:opacity protein-like surface antigen